MNVSAEELARIREQDYLKVPEAAILVRKSRKTLYDAIYAGELDYLQHGERYLVPRWELDAWMRRLAGKDAANDPERKRADAYR